MEPRVRAPKATAHKSNCWRRCKTCRRLEKPIEKKPVLLVGKIPWIFFSWIFFCVQNILEKLTYIKYDWTIIDSCGKDVVQSHFFRCLYIQFLFGGCFNSISIWYSMSCQEEFVLAPFLRLASNNKILSNPTLKITVCSSNFHFCLPFLRTVAPLQLKVVPRTNIVVEEPSVCTTFRLNNND